MSKAKYLLQNTMLFLIGNIGSKIILFILLPVYTMYLSAEEFGITELIQSSINLLVPVLTLGLSDAALRFSMDQHYSKDEVLNFPFRILVFGTIVFSICCYFFSDIYSSFSSTIWWMLPVLFFFTAGRNILSNFSRGIGKVKIFVIDSIINSLVLLVSALLFLGYINLKVRGYLLSLIFASIASFSLLLTFGGAIRYFSVKSISQKTKREMIRYSLPLVPNSLSWWITNLSDRIFVSYYSGLAINGLYSLAYKIPSVLNLVSSIFIQAWQMSVIKEYDSTDKEYFYSETYRYFISLIFIGASLIILFNKTFAVILYKNDFFIAWKYVPILVISFLVSNLHGFLGTIFLAAKQTMHLFLSTFVGALVNVVFNFILIPRYAANGAAFATLISYTVVYILRLFAVTKIVKLRINYGLIFQMLFFLGIQSVTQILELRYSFYYNIGCFLCIILINKRIIIEIIRYRRLLQNEDSLRI